MLPRGFSLYLDAVRFSAAFVVLLSHLAYPRFTEGRWLWIRELNLGSDAVIVFFVLSGLVIGHVVKNQSGNAKQYVFDRVTRLLSVALPALALGFALDNVGAQLAPHFYDGWFYNPLPLWELLLRGLTFSNEWAGLQVRLGTNGPYWSLSYEAAYYALFGIAFYARGARRIALLTLGIFIVGPNVLLLMPTWLLGVALQERIAADRLPCRRGALLLAIVPILSYALALWIDLPGVLYQPAYASALRFSDEFVWNNILAVLVALHFLGMAKLLRNVGSARFESQVRWLAGGSFSLYLMHYPLLQFLAALGIAGPSLFHDAFVVGGTFALCFVFAALFERRLSAWRRALSPIWWHWGRASDAGRASAKR